MLRNFAGIILLALGAVLLAGCPPPPVQDGGANGGPTGGSPQVSGTLNIGHFASLTGSTAMFGQATDEGVKLAAEEISRAGTLEIKVTTLDDASMQEQVPLVVNRLISQYRVHAIVGEVASARSIAAAPVVISRQVPMVSPSSTNPAVTVDPRSNTTRTFVFRVCFTDPFQGAVIARFVREHLKLARAAVLVDVKNPYSVGLAAGFKNRFVQIGGILAGEEAYNEGDSDFRSQLTKIRGLNPEVLIVPGYYREAGLIVKQARDLGITIPIVGGDGWDSETLTNVGPQYFNDCYFSNHFSAEETRPGVREFVDAYRAKYGKTPNALAALGYDAVRIVADAVKRAGSMDRQAIRNALETTKDFPGVTGQISIDREHNAVKPAVVVRVETKDGKANFPLVTSIAP